MKHWLSWSWIGFAPQTRPLSTLLWEFETRSSTYIHVQVKFRGSWVSSTISRNWISRWTSSQIRVTTMPSNQRGVSPDFYSIYSMRGATKNITANCFLNITSSTSVCETFLPKLTLIHRLMKVPFWRISANWRRLKTASCQTCLAKKSHMLCRKWSTLVGIHRFYATDLNYLSYIFVDCL